MTVPKRGRQVKPTRSEVSEAWGRIRLAADNGDVQAIAALIALGEGIPLPAIKAQPASNGVLNFRAPTPSQTIAPAIDEGMSGFKSAMKIQGELLKGKGGRDCRPKGRLMFSTDITRTHKNKDPAPYYSTCLSLAGDLMAEAGWTVGDRVDLRFEPEKRRGLITRVESGGWSLSAKKSSDRVSVKFTWTKGIPTIAKGSSCTDLFVSDIGIMFTFPEGTDFTGNARSETQECRQ